MDVLVLAIAIVLILGVFAVAVVALVLMNDSDDAGSVRPSPSRSPRSSSGGARSSSPPAEKVNWLIGRSGSVQDKTFHLGQRLATIGRGTGNFIQINDENSSRVHAQFQGSASGLQIKDMGSSNGTFVNGEPIGEASFASLNDGDEIQIGDTLLVYRRKGDFRDEALTGVKNAGAAQQQQTKALGAIGGGGDLKAQIRKAVVQSGGDYEEAAQKLGLDAEVVETVVNEGQ